MIKPTVHPNGTSKEDLHARYSEAAMALELAIELLRATAPYSRDYPQGDDVILQARREHGARCDKLGQVLNELTELYRHVLRQKQ